MVFGLKNIKKSLQSISLSLDSIAIELNMPKIQTHTTTCKGADGELKEVNCLIKIEDGKVSDIKCPKYLGSSHMEKFRERNHVQYPYHCKGDEFEEQGDNRVCIYLED